MAPPTMTADRRPGTKPQDDGPRAAPQPRRRGIRMTPWYVPYLFVLPIMALFAVFFVWPAVLAVQLSFYDYSIIKPTVWVGFENFTRMLGDARFWRSALNSLGYLVGLIPLTVVIPLVLAVLVNQKLRGMGAFRFLYYLPVVTSMVAVAIAWRYVFHDAGIINWFLQGLGIIDQPIQFLLDKTWALPALIVVEGWKSMGTYMLIYLAGLQAIPSELYEAARVDGASATNRFFQITVPLMVPYVAVTMVLVMQGATQVFTSVFVLTNGGPSDSTMSLGYYIWSLAFQRFEMGYASAISMVLWIVLVLLAVLNYRVTRARYQA